MRIELTVPFIPWPFPAGVTAVTIWPCIFYEPRVRQCIDVQAHERYHWRDQARWLVLPWLVAYLALLPFYGGDRRHPLERGAYAAQDATQGDVLAHA